ncbi:hypothetical protein ACET9H_17990, partial [Aeromonas media]|uniref:hypothetical protein n=1 Tax=Aeromonas media TaxID=651 RepID=UPI0038D1BB4F
ESGAVAQPTTSEMSRIQAACQGIRRVPSGGIGECRTSKLNSRSTIKFRMDGSILHISPINDHFKFIPTAVKIIKQAGKENKNLLPMGEKGFIDVCRVQREKLFKKSQE